MASEALVSLNKGLIKPLLLRGYVRGGRLTNHDEMEFSRFFITDLPAAVAGACKEGSIRDF